MADGSPLAHSPTLAATTAGGDEQRLDAGAHVGEYVIERFIGGGAMGEVYAGTHPVIGKRVAIKVLRHELASSAEAAERFIREARAVNQIDHENVVDVFAFGRLDDGRLYLVMDLVDGRSLRAALVDGPLELTTALSILGTIADALDAAHARGVVHRDLKPDNIVLSNATPPKIFVLDFGIAKLISTATATSTTAPGTLTGQGTWLGTPGYMAPEQWGADGAGPASDRYALAVIAFELLSGSLPFAASSVPGMMEQHFRAKVPTLSTRGAVGVPAAVDGVLARGLAKDPDARFPTARAFVEALRAAAGSGAHRARGTVASPGSPRTLWLPALAGGGVLAIAVAVAIVSRTDTSTPSPIPQPPIDEPATSDVALEVNWQPADAELAAAGHVYRTSPVRLVAKRGATIEIRVSKPGYGSMQKTIDMKVDNRLVIDLKPIDRFNGTWRLANGELSKLERNGEVVDIYKVTAAHGGEPVFFKHYSFVRTDQGVAFASDDEIIDPRAPNDPRCHVPVHVEYRYNPSSDVLEQHRDKVKISFHDGSCVVQSRDVEPTTLTRVDRPVDEVEIPAPVGVVKLAPSAPRKTVAKKTKAIAPVQNAPAQQQNAPAQEQKNVGKKPQQSYTKATTPPPAATATAQQPQILPQPSAPPINAEDSQQMPRQKK